MYIQCINSHGKFQAAYIIIKLFYSLINTIKTIITEVHERNTLIVQYTFD